MGFFKNLFQKKEIVEEVVKEEPAYIPSVESEIKCHSCGMSIFGEQKVKTFGGHKYHLKPCYRQLLKDAMKVYKGNKTIVADSK